MHKKSPWLPVLFELGKFVIALEDSKQNNGVEEVQLRKQHSPKGYQNFEVKNEIRKIYETGDGRKVLKKCGGLEIDGQ